MSVREQLFLSNPYRDFNHYEFDPCMDGWFERPELFDELIVKTKPKVIVEVGTWLGASAFYMAKSTKEFGYDTEIVCVDTWLGALEFWSDKSDMARYYRLKLKHGYPSVYYQFLANAMYLGHQKVITPLPLTSVIASRLLLHYEVRAELIYIDASHEEEDVYQDISLYYKSVLAPGGIIFGHDWGAFGVSQAVRRALITFPELKYEIDGTFWILQCR